MKRITLQEIKKIVEDNWGVIRGAHRAMRSGDPWANSALAHAVDWKEKLGLDETEQGLRKLKDIMSDPTMSPGAKKVKTQSLKYELDPEDFKDPVGSPKGSIHKDVETSLARGDMDSLANTLSTQHDSNDKLTIGRDKQKNKFIKPTTTTSPLTKVKYKF